MPTVLSTPVVPTNGHAKKLNGKANGNGVHPPVEKNRRHGMHDFFAAQDASDVYSAAEHLTGPVAGPLLEHAGLNGDNITSPIKILDLACGTGIIGKTLQETIRERGLQDKVRLTCSDISVPQVNWVRRRIEEQGWTNSDAVVTDASKSDLPSDNYDYVIMAMALMLVPDPRNVIKESLRMLKPGGTFACSTWLIEGWVPDTYEAIKAANLPSNPSWPADSDELVAAWALGPWHNANFVANMIRAAGFEDVKTEIVTRHITMRDADHFCWVFRAFVRVVTDDYWTQKQRDELLPEVMPAFKTYLEGKYGVGRPFTVERTAIMASGRKPAM